MGCKLSVINFERNVVIGIIGLGYVGLPVGCVFAKAGFDVIGVDVKAKRVAEINAGRSPIDGHEPGLAVLLAEMVKSGRLRATTEYALLARADVVLIGVDTPIDQKHQPHYAALRSACASLGAVMKSGALVIVESTVAPGTVDGMVRPLLEESSGLLADHDFYLGHCPERVMSGKLLANLQTMSRVCGGSTPETAQAMVALYKHIVEADLDATDIVTAEFVKTVENAYRDVQIAFANEVAMVCEVNGADVWRVRELVNKLSNRHMHRPGAGVGGHCIPKDPWLLATAAADKVRLRLVPAARAINDSMPFHMAEMVGHALQPAGLVVFQARVGILGYAYLENSDDIRGSPSAALAARLLELGADVVIHDPWVAGYQGDILARVANCDAVVLMVKHDVYRGLDFSALRSVMRRPILIDGRGFFEPGEVGEAGFGYWGIGRGNE